MHWSVMAFLQENISGVEIAGKSVLEVGSYDVNGSPRSVIQNFLPCAYVGVDSQQGPGVDRVVDASCLTETFGAESFDVVVSTEMLEHALDWRAAVNSMKRVLRLHGLLIITARGPGFPYHGHPHDHWRFTPELFLEIFGDFETLLLKPDIPEMPGVLLKARKLAPFRETDLSKIEPLPAPKPRLRT
jgi:SAM-dependent methyltransferase